MRQQPVIFHELGFRADGAHWIVGRLDTGTCVALPQEGALAVRLLRSGLPAEEVRGRIERELGKVVEVGRFIESMAALGFVRSIDGRAVESPPPRSPTLPRVLPRHVRWALSPLPHLGLAMLAGAGIAVVAVRPELAPAWRDALWSGHGTPVLVAGAAMGWALILLHELGHLFTARAAGVPGVVTTGTRLQFLVVQTDVSGVWLCDRRTRITVYLAGILIDLAVAGGCLVAEAAVGPSRLLSLAVVTELAAVVTEFMIFMRTDIYFVVQDLLGCRNLYGNAVAWLRYAAGTVRGPRPYPLYALSRPEQRKVRAYAVLMPLASMACVCLALYVWVHVILLLYLRAISELAAIHDPLAVVDGVITTLILSSSQILWARAWWSRHGATSLHTARRIVASAARRQKKGGPEELPSSRARFDQHGEEG